MDFKVRSLSPQESRVVLALAEQKRREVGRPEIIKLLGVSAKAADNERSPAQRQCGIQLKRHTVALLPASWSADSTALPLWTDAF